ncbi:DUF1761 domain-containing protein [soil metagenome]
MSVNWLAVIIAAVVRFMIGGAWYMPLFGKRWRELQGIPEGASQAGLGQAMAVGFVGDLVMAYILARFVIHYGAVGILDGLLVAFMAWLGFVATIMVGLIYYEKKPPELVAINLGYQLVSMLAMGIILGLWH